MDDADASEEKSAMLLNASIAQQHFKAQADNVPFIAGVCDLCGEDSNRLVECTHPKDGNVWSCARCRDKYKLTVRRPL